MQEDNLKQSTIFHLHSLVHTSYATNARARVKLRYAVTTSLTC